MTLKMKKLPLALTQALGAGVAFSVAAVPSVLAQQAQPTPQKIEKIEVTGSAIKRIEGETALPITVIRREEIQRSGATTAAELLNRISSNNTSQGYAETTAIGDTGNPGFAGAALRGLPSNKTLVLLNGRRIANFAFGGTGLASSGSADLNSIPLAAIERVEVLKDGASSLYGTDAVGGVINFILRNDFRGFEGTAFYGTSGAGGGQQKRATLTGGFGDPSTDRFNVFATLDYLNSGRLRAKDREFSKSAFIPHTDGLVNKLSANAFPANIYDHVQYIFASPLGAQGCRPPASRPRPAGGGLFFCGFDYASVIDIINPSEKTNAVVRGTFQLTPDHQLYAEGSYSRNRYTFVISPTPASEATTHADPVTGATALLLYPQTGRFYPGAGITPAIPGVTLTPGPISVFYRTFELGGRTDVATVEAYRGVVGGKGTFGGGWDYDAAFMYAKNKAEDVFTSGYVSENAMLAAMATGNLNPFDFNDAQGLALLQGTQLSNIPTRKSSGSTKSVDGKVSKELFQLPAGPVSFAVGAEARKEEIADIFSPIVSSGDILGGGGALQSASGDRNVKGIYTEWTIPIIKNLDATLSARYDRYSDFGGTTNPKIALRWQPSPMFLTRASYGKGFKAPSLWDIVTPVQTGNTANPQDDPVRCPVTQSFAVDCVIQFNTRTGGNPALQPELSEQASLGFVFEPTSSLSVAIDFYRINLSQQILPLTDDAIFTNFAKYDVPGGPIHRGPPQVVGGVTLPGPILFIDEFTQNLGNVHTDGVDLDVNFRGPASAIGRFSVQFSGTYIHKYELQLEQGGVYTENAGVFFNSAPIIRWQHYLALNWDQGPFAATFAQRFYSSYTDQVAPGQPDRDVGAYEVYDIYGAYTGLKNLKIALGIKNLLDRDPPFSRQGTTFPVGYDPRNTDPRGRFFYGSLTYAFK
jgi:iron complex outermembrane recepter protein